MKTSLCLLLLTSLGTVPPLSEEPVTFPSLLLEMADLDALARWPRPAYRQLQASSYNRASTTRGGPGWFADSDGEGFIRTEERDGRTEWVVMEHDGPGCITRIWTPFFYYDFHERTGPNVRIYLDGTDEPVVDCSLIELVQAQRFVGEPFSAHTARAGDLYLPLPFGASCKVTFLGKPFYHIINYRAYPAGTPVESFTKRAFEAAAAELEEVAETLLRPPAPERLQTKSETLPPGGAMKVPLPPGSAAVRYLEIRLTPQDPTPQDVTPQDVTPQDPTPQDVTPQDVTPQDVTPQDVTPQDPTPQDVTPQDVTPQDVTPQDVTPKENESATYLRSTVLVGSFDGETTLWCPAGDFFGCADAVHPFRTLAREVTPEGTLTCRWVMPYERSAELELRNLGSDPVEAHVRVAVGPWTWDDRSLTFHAGWRADDIVPGTPFQDWNFVEIAGQGLLVGDQWTVLNPNGSWWGEGDEKIYVDEDFQRDFPSHFGTGTEDYYGWAGGRVPTRKDEFSHPFLSNIRVGGLDGGTRGFNICARQRGLDAVPFTRRLRFDMEASFGVDIRNPWNLLAYSAVTWWYARRGAEHNRPPSPEAAARPPTSLEDLDQRSREIRDRETGRVEGAIEMEDLEPTAQSEGLGGHRQVPHPRFHPERFSARAHYFVPGRRVGDFVEFTIPEQYEPRRVVLHLVRSLDFGIVQVSVNGRKAGGPIDLYEADPATIAPVDLGEVSPAGNAMTLRVELVGKNPESRASGTYFGLDCVELKEP